MSLSCFFLRLLRPPSSTLFPYTTLFRSTLTMVALFVGLGVWQLQRRTEKHALIAALTERLAAMPLPLPSSSRSEEHTSELQSRQYLVCRLLLEKKKKQIKTIQRQRHDHD